VNAIKELRLPSSDDAGSLDRGRPDELSDGLLALLGSSDARIVVCDVASLVRADLGTVDALARLELTARRQGARLVLIRVRDDLRRLVAFAGLRDVLRVEEALGLEREREPEEREQVRGVEEEARPDDPAL
jgi:ABC-type transporter Mla MlaB component